MAAMVLSVSNHRGDTLVKFARWQNPAMKRERGLLCLDHLFDMTYEPVEPVSSLSAQEFESPNHTITHHPCEGRGRKEEWGRRVS